MLNLLVAQTFSKCGIHWKWKKLDIFSKHSFLLGSISQYMFSCTPVTLHLINLNPRQSLTVTEVFNCQLCRLCFLGMDWVCPTPAIVPQLCDMVPENSFFQERKNSDNRTRTVHCFCETKWVLILNIFIYLLDLNQ